MLSNTYTMEAKSRAFTFLKMEALIRVPFFQRAYVWKKDNWEDLLIELSNTSKNHFLGSIILKQQTVATGEPKEALIIDGQQRLTTLSILLKALYDSLPDATKKNVENSMRNCLFYKIDETDENYLIKIQHSHLDAQVYESVIRAGIDSSPLVIPNDSDSRVMQCYQYFLNELEKKDSKENMALFNWLTKSENEILVVIDLGAKDEEQAIFDTINSAGVHLSAADIIKNALFQKVIQLKGQKEAIKLYSATWNKIITGEKENVTFWETQRSTGRLRRDNIELLLHSVAVIKGIYDPDEHTLSDLSWLYKEHIANFTTFDQIKKFIEDITEYADIYKKKFLIFTNQTMFSFDEYQKRLFHILDCFEISTFHPLILHLFKSLRDDEAQLEKVFSAIESFVVRRVISKHEVKAFNKFCKEFITNPNALYARLAESNDADFYNQLKYISNRHAALLLFWVELHRRHNDKKNDTTALKYCYSLEHIMPQSWTEHWGTLPVKTKPDGSLMSEKESAEDRWAKIYWIGNMTLLTTNLNSALKNYKYEVKMVGEGRKKGIKDYAELIITKLDLVKPFDEGDIVWDEHKIEARTNFLIGEIDVIWKKNAVAIPA
ncbi:MAG: hypothetical protein POELPBGB_01398 [Bacteroidia bacterium]|nr:hypothetical protein [Bacteroidia bacterium]